MAFPEAMNYDFLLGDPFFRDSLLQSAQLLVPQKTCLPVHIRSFNIYPTDSEISASILATARIDRAEQGRIENTVIAVDQKGRVKERLDGYGLQILKHNEDQPAASDLVSPDKRDNHFASKTLNQLCQTLKVKAPAVILKYLPGIHDLSREKRHELELPILREAVRQALEDHTDPPNNYSIQWLESGKPVLTGSLENNLDISLSHDDRLCICTVGTRPQGCDIATITHQSRQDWITLLGRGSDNIFDTLQSENDSLDRAGTRVWAAREALRKAGGESRNSLEIIHREGDVVIFQNSTSKIPFSILTLLLKLTWGPERILAVVVQKDHESITQSLTDSSTDYKDYEDLFDTNHFEIIDNGPQGQGIFIYRLPLGFRPNSQLSRTVYFSNYFFWVGEIREASMWPVLREVSRQFATGKYGIVTNNSYIKILGEATAQDQIEICLWASGNGGPANSTMDLTFDFRKILAGGGYERLAWCEQQVTWVRILEHGVVKPEPYPDYYWHLMKDMLPRYEAPNLPQSLPEPLANLRQAVGDEEQYRSLAAPSILPILHEQIIETSLDNANLVGNIYFANYYAWMGQTRDRYFYQLIPDYYRGTGKKGELLCLECRIDHLREAMPFDRIVVTMALKGLNTFSATFYFEYFRQEPDGKRLKLAVGEHRAIWVKRDDQGQPIPAPFPQPVLNNFRPVITTN